MHQYNFGDGDDDNDEVGGDARYIGRYRYITPVSCVGTRSIQQ